LHGFRIGPRQCERAFLCVVAIQMDRAGPLLWGTSLPSRCRLVMLVKPLRQCDKQHMCVVKTGE
ncbi:unnamed protein product, partial [Sphenostylis stenocarpa]